MRVVDACEFLLCVCLCVGVAGIYRSERARARATFVVVGQKKLGGNA